MRKGIIGLIFFCFLMVGVTVVSAKLGEVHLYTPTLVHDKPTICSECSRIMWSGPEVHQCIQVQIKASAQN